MSDSEEDGYREGASLSRSLRRSPGAWAWLIMLGWAALAVAAKLTNFVQDHAISNILAIVFGGNVAVTMLLWFFWFSDYSAQVRTNALIGLALAVVAAAALLRPVRTSGDLLPSFRFFWQPTGKETPPLADLDPVDEPIDLTQTTPHDFPQYLGPNRNMKLAGPELSREWSQWPREPLWRQPIGAGWSGFVVVGDYALTLEQRENQELVTCYHCDDGKLAWSHGVTARHDTLMGGLGPRSTPTVHEGRVYAMGATGVFRCLDGATGESLWSVDVPKSLGVSGDESGAIAWGRANSPLVVDDLAVIPAGGPANGERHSLAAYDKRTGERRWLGGDDQIGYSSPVVYELLGTRQIVSVNEQTVSGHRIQDGATLWSIDWPGSSAGPANTSQPMRLDRARLLVSKGYNRGAAEVLLSQDQQGSWSAAFGWESSRVLKTKLTSTIVHEGYGYGLNDGILQCVDLTDGALVWKAARVRHGQPLLVGDLLLVMSEWGDLHVFEASPEGGRRVEPLAVFEDMISGTAWNTLCLSGDRLLVRTNKEAACYRLPLRRP